MIWRPTIYGSDRQPLPPQAPPALRVEGGEATALQRNQAQQVFSQFCAVGALSLGPNPMQNGLLPDGTPYRIVTVGPQTTMTIWPNGGAEEDDRRSGIVIALGDLDRQPIPGHETGGVATLYLLTPGVAKGSRIPNGKWKVRKLGQPDLGGKAVNANSTGRIYFTGIGGRQELNYPFNNGMYGAQNEYAYNVEDRDELQMYRGGNEACLSSDEDSPIPFIIDWDNGEKFAAQLVTRRDTETGITSVDLLAGPLANIDPLLDVGPVVDTVSFPSDKTIQRFAISISKDGRRARTVSTSGTHTCQVTFNITPTSLGYVETNCILRLGTESWNFEPPFEETDPDHYRYDNHNAVDPMDGIVKPRPTEIGTGVYQSKFSVSHLFAFGPRGQEFEATTAGIYTYVNSRNIDITTGDILAGNYSFSADLIYKLVTVPGSTELKEFIGEDGVGNVLIDRQGFRSGSRVDHVLISQSGSGYNREPMDDSGGVAGIYYNRYLQFAIYLDNIPPRKYESYTVTLEGEVANPTVYTEAESRLKIKYKNAVLMDTLLGDGESTAFMAYSASDPMTGALCVNLIQVQPNLEGARTRLKSWIFLVDDTGVKQLQTIMSNVPADTGAITNRMLYSL